MFMGGCTGRPAKNFKHSSPYTGVSITISVTMGAAKHPVKFLKLAAVPILQQLQLEEALLRATKHSWFLINEGTPQPSIVMGVSG